MILNKCYRYYITILLLTCANNVSSLFDPITMIVGGFGAGAALYYKLTQCDRNECCNLKYIPADIFSNKIINNYTKHNNANVHTSLASPTHRSKERFEKVTIRPAFGARRTDTGIESTLWRK